MEKINSYVLAICLRKTDHEPIATPIHHKHNKIANVHFKFP